MSLASQWANKINTARSRREAKELDNDAHEESEGSRMILQPAGRGPSFKDRNDYAPDGFETVFQHGVIEFSDGSLMSDQFFPEQGRFASWENVAELETKHPPFRVTDSYGELPEEG